MVPLQKGSATFLHNGDSFYIDLFPPVLPNSSSFTSNVTAARRTFSITLVPDKIPQDLGVLNPNCNKSMSFEIRPDKTLDAPTQGLVLII